MSDNITLDEILKSLTTYGNQVITTQKESLINMASNVDPIDILDVIFYLLIPLYGLYKVQQYYVESLKEKDD